MRIIGIFLITYSILFNFSAQENTKFVKTINFSSLDNQPGEYGAFHEMKVWANYQMLDLIPDHPGLGMKDGSCRIVTEDGLAFLLTADSRIKRPIYLFLDLAVYKPLAPKRIETKKLEVLVNGRLIDTIYFSSRVEYDSPHRIALDPSHLDHDRIMVKLRPGSDENFWCIWDAYYSYERN